MNINLLFPHIMMNIFIQGFSCLKLPFWDDSYGFMKRFENLFFSCLCGNNWLPITFWNVWEYSSVNIEPQDLFLCILLLLICDECCLKKDVKIFNSTKTVGFYLCLFIQIRNHFWLWSYFDTKQEISKGRKIWKSHPGLAVTQTMVFFLAVYSGIGGHHININNFNSFPFNILVNFGITQQGNEELYFIRIASIPFDY